MGPSALPAKTCPASKASAEFDAFDLTDPHRFYAWARTEEPVFFSEPLQYFVVSRYAEIKAIFEDWKTFSSENAQAPLRPICEAAKAIMRDGGFTAYSGLSARVPPDHTRLRKLVQGCFGPRRFRAIEPQIRSIVTRAIDGFASGKAGCDFFRAFAYDVPALVLFKLVGVPDADIAKVKEWAVSRALLTWGSLSDEEQLPHAQNMVAYWAYCRALVRQRHVVPSDDLPGDLIALQAAGAEISDDEIAAVLYSVLFAGHETTTTLIANGLRQMLQNRSAWEAIVADRSLIPGAVEEVLRYDPAVYAWRRRATRDATIGGVAIPKGANILLLLASANRDATVFADPDRFDIGRKEARQHLAFGYGIHYCVGQQLSKMEFAISLEELSHRLPSLRLREPQTFEFVRNTSFRVPLALHVEWDAEAQREQDQKLDEGAAAQPSPFIVPFVAARDADHRRIGGKCSSLVRMIAAGVRVPHGFAVTTEAYAEHVRCAGLRERIASDTAAIAAGRPGDSAAKADHLRAAFVRSPMPADVEAAIRTAYRSIAPDDDLPVAVRSSATAEDLPDASFAGQQDTYLWVVGADAILEKVKACWASLFTARAIAYRNKNGIGHLDVEMAVAIQKMVDAAAAGVAMTLDPINGDRTKIVIDSAFGLGEPLVAGDITPDSFVVEKVLLQIVSRRISSKDHELVADRAAGKTVTRMIETERRTRPSLSDAQAIAVAGLAKSLEKSMGGPQDVEWAIDRDLPDGENVVVLQSRPETVWSRKETGTAKANYRLGIEGVLGTLLAPLQVRT